MINAGINEKWMCPVPGNLQAPLRHDPDHLLESVDLDDSDEGTMQNLEAFLDDE